MGAIFLAFGNSLYIFKIVTTTAQNMNPENHTRHFTHVKKHNLYVMETEIWLKQKFMSKRRLCRDAICGSIWMRKQRLRWSLSENWLVSSVHSYSIILLKTLAYLIQLDSSRAAAGFSFECIARSPYVKDEWINLDSSDQPVEPVLM